MASSRELWIVLRARDEASRVIGTFSKNVRAAALRAQAAAKATEAQRLRQMATEVKWNSALAQTAAQYGRQASSLLNLAAVNDRAAVSAKDYRDNVMSVTGATQTQIDTVNRHIAAIEARSKQLKADAKVQQGMAAAARAANDANVRQIENQALALDGQANALRASANAAEQHDLKLRSMGQSINRVSEMATVSSFAFLALGAAGTIAMSSMIKSAISYEKQVRATATQVDGFQANLKELGDVGLRIANEIGVSFDQIQPALFDIFSSMEVNVHEAEGLLRSFSKAAVAGQTDIQEVSRATIGLLNAFHRPASDVNKILDMQFQLVQEGIGTYEEWNQRIGLVTPSAVRAGQSIEMMTAALAASTRMGMSAARSGTSVARAMDAMSHPKAVQNMEQLGIKVRDANGKFLPMNETLRSFRDVLNKMPEKDRVAAILDVFKGAGGTIEARRFIQNVLLGKNNLELFDQVLKEVQNSAGSMDKAYSIMADSVSVKTELLKNKFQILKISLGEALLPQFERMIDTLQKVLDWFNKLPDSTKKNIANFLLWGTAISLLVGAFLGLIAVLAVVTAAFVTIGISGTVLIGVFALIPLAIGAVVAGFVMLYKKSEDFRNILGDLKETSQNVWDDMKERWAEVKNAYSTLLKPAFEDLKKTIDEKVMPIVNELVQKFRDEIEPRLREAGRIVRDQLITAFVFLKQKIEEDLIPALENLKVWWDNNKETILPYITLLTQIIKLMLILSGFAIAGVIVALGMLLDSFNKLTVAMNLFSFAMAWVTANMNGLKAEFQKLLNLGTVIPVMIASILARLSLLPTLAMSAISSMAGKFFSFFANMFLFLVNLAWNWIKSIVGLFFKLPAMAIAAVASLPNRMGQVFNSMGNVMRGRTVAIIGQIVGLVAGLPGRILGAIGGRMYSVGTSIVQGMINGVRDRSANLAGVARAAALGAVAAAEAALGVKSPSKVFFGIGVNTIQGMINGITKMTRPLEATMSGLASGLAPATSDTLGGVSRRALGGAENNTSGKTIQQNITIHTNEINPRLTAAELGWELTNRM